MSITLKPETERLVQRELESGHFHSIDEMIVEGVEAKRRSLQVESSGAVKAAKEIRRLRQGVQLPAGVSIRNLVDDGRA